uniref:60S ribosomal protein L12 (inferred by orthology to a human protein) n=1 Tax=Strongyloides venezuelensis TaxID=75913 RepID=A0A0K0F6W6_STRVS
MVYLCFVRILSALVPKVGSLGLASFVIFASFNKSPRNLIMIMIKLHTTGRILKFDVVQSATSFIIKEHKEPDKITMLYDNKQLEGTVKEIFDAAQSIGCTIDGQHPHYICDTIDNYEIKQFGGNFF